MLAQDKSPKEKRRIIILTFVVHNTLPSRFLALIRQFDREHPGLEGGWDCKRITTGD